MKLKYLLLSIFTLVFMFSCEDDDQDLNGTGAVSFAITELIEVENTTSPLSINIGVDNFNHSGGTIDISISGAIYGTDYETSTGSGNFTLDIDAQTLVTSFSINPIDNDLIEDNKTLTISLTGTTGALELGENTNLSFTIIENDDPLIAIVAFQDETIELQEDQVNSITIDIPFDQATTDGGTLTITSSGEAGFGADYSINGQTSGDFTLTVPAGATSASFEIAAIDNNDFAADKTATFTISEVSGGLAIGTRTETVVTIVNDDLPPNPVIDFSDSNTLTYNEDVGTLTLNFDISQTTTADATIELTASGSADTADFNFGGSTANPYSFVIPSGSSSGSVEIAIVDDEDEEMDETIVLNITSVSGGLDAGLGLQSQTLTITDNDEIILFSYLETFESNDGTNDYLNSVLNYQNVLVNQTIDASRLISLITNSGSFSDVNNQNASSDNGLNFFYNTGNDPSLNGVVDNVVITPLIESTGATTVNIDGAYAFKNQNSGMATYYWSQTYDGSGTFNESDWTVMGTETVATMDAEGFGNNDYKRQEFNISPTTNFYLAIRVTATVDDANYRLRWRFDNIKTTLQ